MRRQGCDSGAVPDPRRRLHRRLHDSVMEVGARQKYQEGQLRQALQLLSTEVLPSYIQLLPINYHFPELGPLLWERLNLDHGAIQRPSQVVVHGIDKSSSSQTRFWGHIQHRHQGRCAPTHRQGCKPRQLSLELFLLQGHAQRARGLGGECTLHQGPVEDPFKGHRVL